MQAIEFIKGFFPDNVVAGQTTRVGGVSDGLFQSLNLATHVGDAADAVAENRSRLRAALPAEPVWLNQVHGISVARLPTPARSLELPTADASFTGEPNLVAAVLTADCLPVLIARADGQQVGAVHAGWRGLLAGVIETTVLAMAQADPKGVGQRWLFWLGPAIGQGAFEVGQEVHDAFIAQSPAAASAFLTSASGQPGKWMASLSELARQRISALHAAQGGALGDIEILDCGECAFCLPEKYFSYRRDHQTGRMASFIYRTAI
jgi:polyphenol oxidase